MVQHQCDRCGHIFMVDKLEHYGNLIVCAPCKYYLQYKDEKEYIQAVSEYYDDDEHFERLSPIEN